MEKLYQRYSKLGFTILGINVEPDSSKSKRIVKDLGITFPILFDDDGKTSESYSVRKYLGSKPDFLWC